MASRFRDIVLLGLLVLLFDVAFAQSSNITALLTKAKWSKQTTVEFPNSAGFANATERWSTFDEPTYVAVVSPATEKDVVQAVKLATSNGIPFLATGARHGYTPTLGNLKNGLAIDLSQFNSVRVNKTTGVMTVGGGVRMNQVYDPVYEAGYELQAGTASCPGIVGLTLGAGIGPWAGVHGLLLDAVISYRVVTAKGNAITVSKNSHPDLFWAMRGAGGNFGIVVSAKYQLQPQVNKGQILVADIIVPAEKNASYFDLLQSYSANQPPFLSISSFIAWNASVNQLQLTGSWAYLGPQEDGLKAFQPMFDLGLIVGNVQVYPYNKVIQSVAGGADAYICQTGGIHDVYTVNARNISAATYKTVFSEFSTFLTENPAFQTSIIQIAIFPNDATTAVPVESTAYPWRDTKAYIDIEFAWDSKTDMQSVASEVGVKWRQQFVDTSGYPQLAAYINSAHGDESLESIYGADNLSRLRAQKKIWDPTNVFGFNNPIH